jgi:NitT/TauT family transport system substrate-binding protein
MSRKNVFLRRFAFAAAMLLALGTAACGGEENAGTSPKPLTHIRYFLGITPTAGTSPWFVGKERGFFEDAGIDVEFLPGESSTATPQIVGSGEAEFGSLDLMTLGLAKEKDPNLPVEMVAIHHARNIQALFSMKEDANVTEPAQLDGGTVYSRVGSSSGNLLKVWAADQGLKVEIKEADPQALDQLLISGEIPVELTTVFSRPALSAGAEKAGKHLVVLELADHGFEDIYGTGIAVNTDFATENPEVVQAFVDASLEAFQWSFDHPEQAGEIMQSLYPTLPADLNAAAIKEIEAAVTANGTIDRIGAIDPAKVEATLEVGRRAFGINVDPNDLYTTEFVD